MNMDKKSVKRGLLLYLFLALAILGFLYFFNVMNNKVNVISYNEFIEELGEGKITELELIARTNGYTYEARGKIDGYKENETFFARLPLSEEVMKKIVAASDSQNFELDVEPDPDSSSLLYIVVNVLPLLLLVGVAFWFLNRQLAGSKSSLDLVKVRLA